MLNSSPRLQNQVTRQDRGTRKNQEIKCAPEKSAELIFLDVVQADSPFRRAATLGSLIRISASAHGLPLRVNCEVIATQTFMQGVRSSCLAIIPTPNRNYPRTGNGFAERTKSHRDAEKILRASLQIWSVRRSGAGPTETRTASAFDREWSFRCPAAARRSVCHLRIPARRGE